MRFFSSKKFFVILLLSTVLLSAALLLSACENAAGRFPAAPEITEGIDETPAPVPPVEIDGVLFSAETPRLVLSGLKVDETVLEEVLPSFEVLDSLDLRGTSISHEYALSLSERYPETEIFWDVRLFGMLLPSDTKELDLTDTQLDSLNEVEDALKYYPYLEKVILPDIGFP